MKLLSPICSLFSKVYSVKQLNLNKGTESPRKTALTMGIYQVSMILKIPPWRHVTQATQSQQAPEFLVSHRPSICCPSPSVDMEFSLLPSLWPTALDQQINHNHKIHTCILSLKHFNTEYSLPKFYWSSRDMTLGFIHSVSVILPCFDYTGTSAWSKPKQNVAYSLTNVYRRLAC